jgi:hypothetical protein
MHTARALFLGTIFGLLLGTMHSGQALRLCVPSMRMAYSAQSFRARKRAAYTAHARRSSELTCHYYFARRTFAYPPQSPRKPRKPRTRQPAQQHRSEPRAWWRGVVCKLRKWQRQWVLFIQHVFTRA